MTESRAAMAAKGMSRARVWLECIRATVLAIPPTLVVLLLMWSYYVFNYIYVRQYLVNPLEQAMYLSVYHAVLLVFCTTYYRAVTTKPSGPPPQFGLSERELDDLIEGSSPSDMVAKRRLPIRTLAYNGLLRFCFTCKALKPDRCHHCSVCRRCVLKMDHHCPWVGNCVGWHNYKFFILFLFWGIVYLLMFMYAIFPVVHQFIASDSHRNARSPGQGPILLSFLLAISFSLSMFILLLFHLVLIASNRTTLEGFSSLKFVRPSSRGWRLPGILANFEEVFGPLSYKWLLPVGKGSSGTGWDFSVVHDQGISHV